MDPSVQQKIDSVAALAERQRDLTFGLQEITDRLVNVGSETAALTNHKRVLRGSGDEAKEKVKQSEELTQQAKLQLQRAEEQLQEAQTHMAETTKLLQKCGADEERLEQLAMQMKQQRDTLSSELAAVEGQIQALFERPATTPLTTEPGVLPETGLPREQKQFLTKAITALQESHDAKPFLYPVDPMEDGVLDYLTKITTPMDLGLIYSKLRCNQYQSAYGVVEDVVQLVENTRLFNGADNHLTQSGERLLSEFGRLISGCPGPVDISAALDAHPRRHYRSRRPARDISLALDSDSDSKDDPGDRLDTSQRSPQADPDAGFIIRVSQRTKQHLRRPHVEGAYWSVTQERWSGLSDSRRRPLSDAGRIEETPNGGPAQSSCKRCAHKGFDCKVYTDVARAQFFKRPAVHGFGCSRCLNANEQCSLQPGAATHPRKRQSTSVRPQSSKKCKVEHAHDSNADAVVDSFLREMEPASGSGNKEPRSTPSNSSTVSTILPSEANPQENRSVPTSTSTESPQRAPMKHMPAPNGPDASPFTGGFRSLNRPAVTPRVPTTYSPSPKTAPPTGAAKKSAPSTDTSPLSANVSTSSAQRAPTAQMPASKSNSTAASKRLTQPITSPPIQPAPHTGTAKA